MKMNAPDVRNADGTTFNSEKDVRLTKIGGFLRKQVSMNFLKYLTYFWGI